MKKSLLLFAVLLGFSEIIAAQTASKELYYQGETDSLYSDILKENRKFFIYNPQSTRVLKMGDHAYPVLYLLDGNSSFAMVSQIINWLSTDAVPPMIVVGILNTNRTRDYTPSYIPDDPTGFDVSQSGGGEAFLDFIEKELIPHIDKNYKTTPYRTFVGHSLGGLLTGYTLATRPHLFNNFLSLDPTTTWDEGMLIRTMKEGGTDGRFSRKGYFLGVADAEPTGQERVDSLLDVFRSHNLQLADYLNQRTDLNFLFRNYPQGSHGDMVVPAIYDGLKFLFSWYAELNFEMITSADPLFSKDVSSQELSERINDIHQKLSSHFGYEVKPNEDLINSLGYWSMQAGDMDKSKLFFEMNISNYPESANVYDSMGDYFVAVENKDEAIRFFREALKRDDNVHTKKKLDELQE